MGGNGEIDRDSFGGSEPISSTVLMLYWAMGASEAIDLLEFSDLNKEVFQPCEGLAREGWLFLGGGV